VGVSIGSVPVCAGGTDVDTILGYVNKGTKAVTNKSVQTLVNDGVKKGVTTLQDNVSALSSASNVTSTVTESTNVIGGIGSKYTTEQLSSLTGSSVKQINDFTLNGKTVFSSDEGLFMQGSDGMWTQTAQGNYAFMGPHGGWSDGTRDVQLGFLMDEKEYGSEYASEMMFRDGTTGHIYDLGDGETITVKMEDGTLVKGSINEQGVFSPESTSTKAAAVKPDAAKKQEANITKDTKGQQKGTSKGKKNEGEKQAKEGNGVNTGHEVNVLHYPILILEGVEARKQKEFTRKVVVEGASKLQASQGSPQGSDIHPDVSLEATTLGCAANSMSVLLENNPVRLQLLNLDDLDLDTEGGKFVAKYRRNLLLQEYAVAAEIIGEGSNAISEKFYDRIQGFVGEIPGTYGTLGAMSVLNDSERYPYFEMVRQLALTAVQLGLSGATTLANVKAINENAVNEEVNK